MSKVLTSATKSTRVRDMFCFCLSRFCVHFVPLFVGWFVGLLVCWFVVIDAMMHPYRHINDVSIYIYQ